MNRRSFLNRMGALTLICMGGDILQSFFNRASLLDVSAASWHAQKKADSSCRDGIRACFVGTGTTGLQLAAHLSRAAGRMGSGKDNGRGGLPIYLFERDHDKIGQLIDNQDLIFTVGSLDDPSFWLARDLALSSSHFVDRWRLNPDGSFSIKSVVEYPLLITVGAGKPGITVLRPAEREGVLVMSGSVDLRQAADQVLLLYASVAIPGFICFDFADCRQVFSGGIIQPLIYWTSSQERGDRLL
jgi:hypothetical protein